MKKLVLYLFLAFLAPLGFGRQGSDTSVAEEGGPKVLRVYHYTNALGKVFEFRVVSTEDYKVYGRAYARRWDDTFQDCVQEQGDCMDDVVITPED